MQCTTLYLTKTEYTDENSQKRGELTPFYSSALTPAF
ncbi:hypothetical protein ALP80_200040 [Pseudomonas savastanoi pv. fraxini]|nr:hypothetical protein ALP80_200040 [Pseudomonas savastanoi pv. fraxini]